MATFVLAFPGFVPTSKWLHLNPVISASMVIKNGMLKLWKFEIQHVQRLGKGTLHLVYNACTACRGEQDHCWVAKLKRDKISDVSYLKKTTHGLPFFVVVKTFLKIITLNCFIIFFILFLEVVLSIKLFYNAILFFYTLWSFDAVFN